MHFLDLFTFVINVIPPYNNKNNHTCKEQKMSACLLCMNEKHDPDTKAKVLCEYCGRYCFNDKCHFEHGYRVCPYKYKCKKCNKLVARLGDMHKCGYERCRNCGLRVYITNHKCYMTNKAQKGGICGCNNCSVSTVVNKKCTYTEN